MNIQTITAVFAACTVLTLAAVPAHAGVAAGTLSLSIRIVDSCDVRTELPGHSYPASTLQAPHSRSMCNFGVPGPRVTTTVVIPPKTNGKRTGVDPVKIVTIYL